MSVELNYDNLTTEEQQFKNGIEGAGIPTAETDIKEEFQTCVDESNISITNTSPFSPFWQLIQAVAIKPAFWLFAFVVRFVMPQSYAKTATGTFLDLIAWAYDLERKEAAKAIGELTFSRETTGQPLTVPEGTTVRTIAINGTNYRMIVTADTDFAAGETTVRVPVEAENAGLAYNLAEGYYSILETEVPGVTGVTNESDWLSSPGADNEPDDEFRLRIRNQFTAVSDWHTDAKYTAMITERTGFRADRIYFDHNIPRGPGSADAYILFDVATPSSTYLDDVNDYIQTQGNHGHGDDFLVKAMPETLHDVDLTVHFDPTLTSTEKTAMLADIEQFVRCAFRENTDYIDHVTQVFAWSRFSFSVLDQEIHNYFTGIVSLVWGTEDIESVMDVPRIDNLTIAEAA